MFRAWGCKNIQIRWRIDDEVVNRVKNTIPHRRPNPPDCARSICCRVRHVRPWAITTAVPWYSTQGQPRTTRCNVCMCVYVRA